MLPAMQRHTVADFDVTTYSAVVGGRLVLLGERAQGDGYGTVLVWCGEDGRHLDALDYVPDVGWPEHRPTLLAHPDGGCVVLPDPTRAFRHVGPGEWHEIEVAGAELVAEWRLRGGTAVSDTPDWWVVFGPGVLAQELRYAARLELDPHKAQWRELRVPNVADFPADRFGVEYDESQFDPAEVSLTATLRRAGTDYVVSEGSDLGSTLAYGADFFTCATVDGDGRLLRRVHEQHGWKRQSGKHGIRGRFTADGGYLLLTPVFKTGEWKGRQRVLSLADDTTHVPVLPRGLTKATVLDHHSGTWWLRSGDDVIGLEDLELS